MNGKKHWIDQLKKIPEWIKGAIALIVALAGFIVAFRNEPYLYSVLLGFLILLGLLYVFTYIGFARRPASRGKRGAFKYDRYRRLAIVGDVALIAIAVLILSSKVGQTYLFYAFEGSSSTRLSENSLSNTAIYISKIVKDPKTDFPDATTFAVWLSATGDYYVDSIRVVPECSNAASATESGAQPPDANYVFTYTDCSNETYVLNPALYLDSTDKREVYFTVGLVPKDVFGGGGGYPHATIYYHTSNGQKGSLILEEPPADIVMLSQLLNMYVLADGLLVSPNGLQRGYEEGMEKSDDTLEYTPLYISTILPHADILHPSCTYPPSCDGDIIYSYLASDSPAVDTPIIDLGKREKINEMLIEQDKVTEIISGLSTGMPIYFDLCAGLANPECKKALLDTPFRPEYFWEKARALIFIHMIHPDTELADFVLANISTLSLDNNEFNASKSALIRSLPSPDHFYGTTTRLVFALKLHPVGSWFEALVKIASYNDYRACQALRLLKNKMDEAQLLIVRDVCKQ